VRLRVSAEQSDAVITGILGLSGTAKVWNEIGSDKGLSPMALRALAFTKYLLRPLSGTVAETPGPDQVSTKVPLDSFARYTRYFKTVAPPSEIGLVQLNHALSPSWLTKVRLTDVGIQSALKVEFVGL
jgi:hypothetical protein